MDRFISDALYFAAYLHVCFFGVACSIPTMIPLILSIFDAVDVIKNARAKLIGSRESTEDNLGLTKGIS